MIMDPIEGWSRIMQYYDKIDKKIGKNYVAN